MIGLEDSAMKGIWRYLFVGCLGACFALAGNCVSASPYPSPDDPWTKHDYVDFYFSHFNGNQALPHLRTAEMRALFTRLVDHDNISRITESGASPEEKRRHITMILMTLGEIRASYTYAVTVGEPLQEESAELQSFVLFVLDTALRLSDGIAIDPQRRDSWRTTLLGVVQSLSEGHVYSAKQRAALSLAIAGYYPELRFLLAEADKREISNRIGKLLIDDRDQEVRAAHAELLRAINAR